MMHFDLSQNSINLLDIEESLYADNIERKVTLPSEESVLKSHFKLMNAIEERQTIYGVTTGFGDCSRRIISPEHSAQLQANLISYLSCGVGEVLPRPVCRAVVLYRLQSLSRGISAVSYDLLKRMKWMVEEDVIPKIPSQGSLGASGDLVPLAYLAQAIQGKGEVWHRGKETNMEDVCEKFDLPPYILKPKEGLALVNGTTVMAAYGQHNQKIIHHIYSLTEKLTAFCVIAMNGRKDAFNKLINSKAKQFSGQSHAAATIHDILDREEYVTPKLNKVEDSEERTETVQDKYSLRCAPQILGPVLETLQMSQNWIGLEANGVSDNPVIDEGDEFSMGGNFYGGYISHAMDYLKISMAHLADMIDRQFMCLIDENTNRGLPPNLADWDSLPEDERFIHHGLKGLNQAMSAITSEVMAQSNPGGIYSRSSEAHNQDKVSLGLSACIQADKMFDNMYTLLALHLIGCCQAIDLRKISVKTPELKELYELTRSISPKVTQDRQMDKEIMSLRNSLKNLSGAFNEL